MKYDITAGITPYLHNLHLSVISVRVPPLSYAQLQLHQSME